ncbi:Quinol monooxygenase YgiN [Streptoalloteichus hindustanus]|uniref:Quinol monooxygenase YgiN n=1 Tax=Streptoalloteichus hindustanus TaxID=2017 RepID=A0A1M5HEW5_STRHI|nr:Quinol monooxygenase YgiN [Streptoalloteichus hindustanus]
MVELLIRKGAEEAFLAAYRDASQHVLAVGCRTLRLVRSSTDPRRFLVIGEWDTVDDPSAAFQGSDGFVRWRDAVSEFFAEPPFVDQGVQLHVETTPVETPAVQTAAVQTAAVQTAAVETAAVETTAVEPASPNGPAALPTAATTARES